jgi:acyl carrier protein
MTMCSHDETFRAVCRALSKIDQRVDVDHISPDASIVHDLGFDSLKFIDLTFILEDILQIEFSIQDWIDQEDGLGGRYSVDSLARACSARLREKQEI